MPRVKFRKGTSEGFGWIGRKAGWRYFQTYRIRLFTPEAFVDLYGVCVGPFELLTNNPTL